MAKRRRQWVWGKVLGAEEKATITADCERLIATSLKPRFLPQIKPTAFNYPIDLFGRWRGSKYSFIVRFRSGHPDNAGEEFNSAYARIDHVEEAVTDTRFDVMWHRHTGQWWPLHRSVPLAEALHLIETDPVLRPPI
jgi:hypothetical protein